MEEQPIVTIGEVAKFLRVGKYKARAILKQCKAPLIDAYKPIIAVFPSELRKALKRKNA